MRTIHTEISISAPASTVWKILTDFKNYNQWNPFILSIENTELKIGERLKVSIAPPNSDPMIFKPKILGIRKNQSFVWKGKLLIPGIFDGEHTFEIITLDESEVLFIHRESFSGILSGPIFKSIKNNVHDGFELMNVALKERAEKMSELQLHALSDFRLYEHLN